MIVQPDNAAADPEQIIADLQRRLDESVAQQAATAEVMQLINASSGNLAPVFDAIVDKAMRLCDAGFGGLWVVEGDLARAAATRNLSDAYTEFLTRRPVLQAEAFGPKMKDQPVVHIADLAMTESYRQRAPITVASVELGGIRTYLAVPLRESGALAGVISMYRKEVRPFTDRQIVLVQGFAAQAEIAMTNARLFEAERQRSRELSESLEQQTATSEVLEVVSRSPGDLEPVFAAMLENAVRICDAKFGNIHRWDGDTAHLVATHKTPPAFAEARRRLSAFRPGPNTGIGRMVATKTVTQIVDLTAEPTYAVERVPAIVAAVELGGVRTFLAVPMLKENELIGAFTVYRQEVRPFTDKQIELVQNFAAQAVIAIENTRLLSELRESLQQQTATADVLKIISRSTFDLKTVLNTLVESAARLCEADMASIPRQTGAIFDHVATYGYDPAFQEFLQRNPISAGRGTVTGRAVLEGKTVHIPDVLNDPEYSFMEGQSVGGYRTALGVPLLREGNPIGVIVLVRREVRPFTDKQIELATSFADQAVIAIENVRLFEAEQQRTRELTESLEQQTATSEVLQVISSSPGDLEPVFATMLENAVRICDAKFGDIYRWEGDALRLAANHNTPPAFAAFAEERKRSQHLRPSPTDTSVSGRMVATKSVIHVADLPAERAYIERSNQTYVAAVELAGARTILLVPMLKENELIGAFILCRQEVRPFTDKQVELVKNFAAQAVIAIENARLLSE